MGEGEGSGEVREGGMRDERGGVRDEGDDG